MQRAAAPIHWPLRFKKTGCSEDTGGASLSRVRVGGQRSHQREWDRKMRRYYTGHWAHTYECGGKCLSAAQPPPPQPPAAPAPAAGPPASPAAPRQQRRPAEWLLPLAALHQQQQQLAPWLPLLAVLHHHQQQLARWLLPLAASPWQRPAAVLHPQWQRPAGPRLQRLPVAQCQP